MDTLSDWNAFTYSGGSTPLSPYNMPTADEMDMSAVDSSGNSIGIGTGLQLGSSVLGAFGNILSGNEYQGADEYNAQLALTQGQFNLDSLDNAEDHVLGTQRAMYAKAGVTMSGSPLDTAFNTASAFEMDKQISNYNAQSKANMLRYEGKVAQSKSEINAGTTLLQGAGTAALALALL